MSPKKLARQTNFESLLAEAQDHPFTGWDFSWIKDRVTTRPLPWSYAELIMKHARLSPDLLDLGTGGGEFLASLAYRPVLTVATDSYAPNVPVAARRLHPLNVAVVQVEAAPDNNVQTANVRAALPFKDSSFHLVVNRHSSFVAKEVSRILAPQGRFVTQQIGESKYHDFHRLLKVSPPRRSHRRWDLRLAEAQLEAAGLHVKDSQEGIEVRSFRDIGAFAWYLKAIPWIIDRFSVPRYHNQLKELHLNIEKEGSLKVRLDAFLLEAIKESN